MICGIFRYYTANNFSVIKGEYKYSFETSKIIGAALEVHKGLGNGFPEIIYQRALESELIKAGITFEREKVMPVHYKGEVIGTRRVDFLACNTIPVEIKAVAELTNGHLAQAINYLEAFNLEIGLLINFGSKSLEFRRVMNNKFIQLP